jgi:hypothetical protein
MGMIAESKSTNLNKMMYQFITKPSIATIPKAIATINIKRNFESLFTSRSNFPILTRASFEFISERVSLPV